LDVARLLFAAGADVNATSSLRKTPMHVAASGGPAFVAGTALASHQLLLTIYATLSFATDSLAIAAQQIVAVEPRAGAKRAAASRILA
jgi:ankyrin repeat protein